MACGPVEYFDNCLIFPGTSYWANGNVKAAGTQITFFFLFFYLEIQSSVGALIHISDLEEILSARCNVLLDLDAITAVCRRRLSLSLS